MVSVLVTSPSNIINPLIHFAISFTRTNCGFVDVVVDIFAVVFSAISMVNFSDENIAYKNIYRFKATVHQGLAGSQSQCTAMARKSGIDLKSNLVLTDELSPGNET